MSSSKTRAEVRPADIVREYGPFEGVKRIHGVTHDGHQLWAATGTALMAIDTATGQPVRRIEQGSDAGTAFDGRHFWQITEQRIDKIDAASGRLVGSIPAPGKGCDSGLTWAEGSLWVGQYRDRRIHQIDPATGAIVRTIESDRFVTGVTWVDGELWHAVWEGDESELRHIDPADGTVLERLRMPEGTGISGLESDGADLFYCGGGGSGKVRAVRRPRQEAARSRSGSSRANESRSSPSKRK
jgi:glutamine cyclotransferase